MLTKSTLHFFIDDSGQGITEYGAILAFVALVASVVFALQGNLAGGISNSFSAIQNQLNSLSSSS